MLEVKPLLPDQWLLLKAIRLQALTDSPEAFGMTLAQAEMRTDAEWQENARRFASLPPAASFIACHDGVSCGMVNCFLSQENSQVAEMTAFWVAPKHRGHGISDALVASIIGWATTQSVTMLQAWVVEDNHRAIGFYKEIGFQETGQRQPHAPEPSKQIVLLAKRL
ncbi:MAG: GNAT family N-acetyltransferase [Janthinobacterium lividum]